MFDFVSIGEMLIDFTPYMTEGGSALYQPNPGGAPANVASVVAKLGLHSAFVGKVGNDVFGLSCKEALKNAGVCTEHLVLTSDYPTTLAFVTLLPGGNREFSFYRNRLTADVILEKSDLSQSAYQNTRIFHFGSVSLTEDPEKSTVLFAVEEAKKAGAIISYDPNLRLPLWKSAEEAKKTILETLHYADILKLSEEEVEFLFGKVDDHEICKELSEKHGVSLILITKAADGCYAYVNGRDYHSYAYDLKTIDTTGAGDSFLAWVVYCLLHSGKDIKDLSDGDVTEMLDFANALGSLVTTKKGAIPAIPSIEEINRCMEMEQKLIPKQ